MNNEEMKSKINTIFSKFDTKPVLFIGSGISRRYLELPDWVGLLKHFSSLVANNNSLHYGNYRNTAKNYLQENNLDQNLLLPYVATLIEKDYNDKFYKVVDFEPAVKKAFAELDDEELSPFKLAICLFKKEHVEFTKTFEHEEKALRALKNKVSNIITTNYDDFIEKIMNNYSVLTGQEKIFSQSLKSIGNIFKIHGSVDKPATLVISKEDYDDFNERSKFLSAKLLTFFCEYPVIFLGYSMNDDNIKKILQDIKMCLNEEASDALSQRLIFIDWVDTEEKQSIITGEIAGVNMIKIKLTNFNYIYQGFDSILDAIDVATLRNVEDKIVQLIQTSDQSVERVYATSLENENLSKDNLAIFIGNNESIFSVGYSAITLLNICEDVLFNTKCYDAKGILNKTILMHKNMFKQSKLPLHKYCKNYDDELDPFYSKNNSIIRRLEDLYNHSEKRSKYYKSPIRKLYEIVDVDSSLDIKLKFIYYSLNGLDINEVKNYIKDIWKDIDELERTTHLTKIVCAIDFFENGQN